MVSTELNFLNTELEQNKLTINELKRILISRDSNNKILAVKTILKIITTHETKGLIQQLINADIIELLCEASCTTNPILLRMIFQCISQFIDNKKFFEQHHTTYTFEYVIRSLYVLLKIDKERETFKYGLQLVCFLIHRVKLLEISLNNVCNISNIANLLRQLFTSNESPPVIFVAIEVILNLLQSKDINSLKESLIEITFQALQQLTIILKKEEKNKEFIIITAELVTNSMRFLIRNDENRNTNNLCQKLLMELFLILKEIFVPVLIETNFCESDLQVTQIVLNGLLSLYYSPEQKINVEFSEFLVSKGILSFILRLESQISTDDLIITIRSILYEVLVHLSQHLLGDEEWKYLISPGLQALPSGSSYNTIFLNGRDIIYPISSIVFNYFYLMSFSSPVVDLEFLQNICQFILFLDEKPSYPIMKALWFNFAVAYLCGADNFPQSKVPMMKLIRYLSNSDITSIYTHHPAILYWTFSDYVIPHELQAHVIVLWTDKNDSQSTTELYSIMKINKDSCLLIMEIMTLCEIKISGRIQYILSKILQEHGNAWKHLYEHAWSILPTSLAKYSSNPEYLCYESVSNLMKYCWEFIPPNIEQTLIMRISCLLPGAFTKYFNLSYHCQEDDTFLLNTQQENTVINSFNLANSLLTAGKESQDKRVAVTLLGHEEFLKCVEYFLAASNENVTTSVMNLLTMFLLNQKKSNYWGSKVIQLEGMKVVKFLQCGRQLSVAVLKFLAHYLEILSENLGTAVVQIPPPTALQIRALYLHIHMICAKSDDSTGSWCWSCLRRLLGLSESMGLQEHLAMLPFTPALLLKTKDSPAWEEVVKFLSVWLKIIPKHSRRSLSTPISLKVIQHFSNKIDKSLYSKDLIETLNKCAPLKNLRKE